jgi:hypothetical protein
MKFILSLSLMAFIISSAMAQVELHPQDADKLVQIAHQAVERYSLGLTDIGGTRFQEGEKMDFVSDALKVFESATNTMVINDLDPKNNTSDLVSIDTYLYTLYTQYNKYGLQISTQITDATTKSIYIDPIDQEFLFVKVVIQRDLKGTHNTNGDHDTSHLLDVYVQFARTTNGDVIRKAQITGIGPHIANDHTFQRVPIQGEVTTLNIQSPPTQPAVSAPTPNVSSPPSVDVTRPQPTTPTQSGCTTPDSDPTLIHGESAWEDFYRADAAFQDIVVRRGMTAVAELTFTITAKGTLGNGINVKVHTKNAEIIGEVEEMAKRLLREFSMSSDAWMPAQKQCRQLDALTELDIRLNANKKNPTSPKTPSAKQPKSSGSCNDPESRPYFNDANGSEQQWRQFYLQDEVYIKATTQNNVGLVEVTFTVKADGTIDTDGIGVLVKEGPSGEQPRNQLRYLAKTIVARSQGWKPGKRDCQAVAMSVKTEIRFERCLSGLQGPCFEGQSNYHSKWKEYVSKNESFVRAVLNGTRGSMDARFQVVRDGSVPSGSMKFSLTEGVGRAIGEELIEKSSAEGKWSPATSDCQAVERNAHVSFRFAKSRMDPATVLKVANLSYQEKRKWEKKAEWTDWKDRKKGGVHFSIGGAGSFFLPTWVVDTTASGNDSGWRQVHMTTFIGGEVAFGGMFDNVGGMEVRYGLGWDMSNGILAHRIALGGIINASPNRWPVRFYFPIHIAGIQLSRNHDLVIEDYEWFGELRIGVLCMDIKMDKYSSFFMELGSFSWQTDFYWKQSSRFAYTTSLGFRVSRW